jgi:putative urate catabolism protein
LTGLGRLPAFIAQAYTGLFTIRKGGPCGLGPVFAIPNASKLGIEAMSEPLPPPYPRDLIGYGRNPPDPRWPGQARVAVQFVVNYEEGSERSILHGDETSEAFLSDVLGTKPWPGKRHMNVESMYEYGSRAGFWRLWRIFNAHKIPTTVFGVAMALERNPDVVAAMRESKWEIASHGLRWIDYKDFTEGDERNHMAEAIRVHQAATGTRPLGWYTGRSSAHTLKAVLDEGGFRYSSDSYADDLPHWVNGPKGPHLIIPYTLDCNDMRFINPQGFPSSEEFFTYMRDAFDVLYAEGESAPKMMSVGLHCRLAGRPGRAVALQRFLDHIGRHDKVWLTTRLDIAEHWHREHAGLAKNAPAAT